MRLLLAVDTITTLDIVLKFLEARSWSRGTEAEVLSVVEDESVPVETWRAEGYGVAAIRREMRRRGEQISALVIERLRAIGIPAQVTIMRGVPAFLIPFAARKWSEETEVNVVSVINPITYSLEEIGFSRGKESERAHQAIGKTVNMLSTGPSKVTGEVIAGMTARQIVARAREWNADLIVVGTEERTGLKRLISRGTAIAVANRAHCSVRVARRNNVHEQHSLGQLRKAA